MEQHQALRDQAIHPRAQRVAELAGGRNRRTGRGAVVHPFLIFIPYFSPVYVWVLALPWP